MTFAPLEDLERRTVFIDEFELARCEPGHWPGPDAEWMAATVPGGVHEVLEAAGRIPPPYYGMNESEARWVEDATWCYRTRISVPGELVGSERLWLVFHGLDGVATVRVGGVEVAEHANAHRPLALRLEPGSAPGAGAAGDGPSAGGSGAGQGAGPVEVLIRFSPPLPGAATPERLEAGIEVLRARQRTIRPGAEPPPDEVLAVPVLRSGRRKAAFSWGWDFAPRLPSIGLWGPVALVRDAGAVIEGVHARTTRVSAEARQASVAVTVTLDDEGSRADQVRISIGGPDGQISSITVAAQGRVDAELDLSGVDLWWTRDLGRQPRYDLLIELLAGGRVLDSRSERIGLRILELDRGADDEGGHRFRLLLNGVPLFCRGANWVPASMFVGSIPGSKYRRLVELAAAGNMNMLRIWGGGIYEPDSFFDACDELGVLVWQDFMFACDAYPDDSAFREEVTKEAAHQIARLRNRPSLAVWCGNNEVQALQDLQGRSLEQAGWGRDIFHRDLPSAVSELAPGAIYWPGSPWSEEPGERVNSTADGDRHTWEVWHGLDIGIGDKTPDMTRGQAVHFRRYEKDQGRFISEFGIHACPELPTLRRWLPQSEVQLRSPGMDHHNKDTPKDKGWALMEEETGAPSDLAEYVDFSMACQAEGLKVGVEHYRRRQPYCSGTLVWQFDDPWPGLTWSVVDYDLVPKAGYYFLQRAYRPVIASFRPVGERLELWVTNSSPVDASVQLNVGLAGADGSLTPLAEVEAGVTAHQSTAVWENPLPPVGTIPWVTPRDTSTHGSIAANRRFLAPLKELDLDGRVEGTARRSASGDVEVELSSSGYSYLARVMSPVPGVTFDQNYVDLLDGQTAVIRLSGLPDDVALTSLEVASYRHAAAPCRPS